MFLGWHTMSCNVIDWAGHCRPKNLWQCIKFIDDNYYTVQCAFCLCRCQLTTAAWRACLICCTERRPILWPILTSFPLSTTAFSFPVSGKVKYYRVVLVKFVSFMIFPCFSWWSSLCKILAPHWSLSAASCPPAATRSGSWCFSGSNQCG